MLAKEHFKTIHSPIGANHYVTPLKSILMHFGQLFNASLVHKPPH